MHFIGKLRVFQDTQPSGCALPKAFPSTRDACAMPSSCPHSLYNAGPRGRAINVFKTK